MLVGNDIIYEFNDDQLAYSDLNHEELTFWDLPFNSVVIDDQGLVYDYKKGHQVQFDDDIVRAYGYVGDRYDLLTLNSHGQVHRRDSNTEDKLIASNVVRLFPLLKRMMANEYVAIKGNGTWVTINKDRHTVGSVGNSRPTSFPATYCSNVEHSNLPEDEDISIVSNGVILTTDDMIYLVGENEVIEIECPTGTIDAAPISSEQYPESISDIVAIDDQGQLFQISRDGYYSLNSIHGSYWVEIIVVDNNHLIIVDDRDQFYLMDSNYAVRQLTVV